jgi:hypothetical protein
MGLGRAGFSAKGEVRTRAIATFPEIGIPEPRT